MSCFCTNDLDAIIKHFERSTVPDAALTRPCCWTKICEAHDRSFDAADDKDWRLLRLRRANIIIEMNSSNSYKNA